MQQNQNWQNAPFIQKVVPVKKNGFVLELQVAPPNYAPPAMGNGQAAFQQPQPQFIPQAANYQPQIQQQTNYVAEQQSQINLNQAQIEESAQKPAGALQSLRDLFKGR
jgi:hypothetical protein